MLSELLTAPEIEAVFRPICRHRAMRVLAGKCSGRTDFSRPRHAWTYDLDGELLSTPRIGGDRESSDVHENYKRRGDAGIAPHAAPYSERNVQEFQKNVIAPLRD